MMSPRIRFSLRKVDWRTCPSRSSVLERPPVPRKVSTVKLRCTLAFVCMTCVTALASAGASQFVHVPADELSNAVELLAKQYQVDVIYPSDLLRGRATRGLNGAFE